MQKPLAWEDIELEPSPAQLEAEAASFAAFMGGNMQGMSKGA